MWATPSSPGTSAASAGRSLQFSSIRRWGPSQKRRTSRRTLFSDPGSGWSGAIAFFSRTGPPI
eukprot:6038077-Lingulodinium_polyedra.AAC.1